MKIGRNGYLKQNSINKSNNYGKDSNVLAKKVAYNVYYVFIDHNYIYIHPFFQAHWDEKHTDSLTHHLLNELKMTFFDLNVSISTVVPRKGYCQLRIFTEGCTT